MGTYRSGYDLEDAVFNCHSIGGDLTEKYIGQRPDFDKDVRRLIRRAICKHPKTKVAEILFGYVEKELKRFGIDTKGLVFLSAINTKVDLKHFADGIFYLPAVPQFPVTIDAFNISSSQIVALKNRWIDDFEEAVYTDSDFQSDLFRFKTGLARWKKECAIAAETGQAIIVPQDFRFYVACSRPENHFVLTPYSISSYKGRNQLKEFAKMVAGYFASKATINDRSKMAQQSRK